MSTGRFVTSSSTLEYKLSRSPSVHIRQSYSIFKLIMNYLMNIVEVEENVITGQNDRSKQKAFYRTNGEP